VWDYFNHTCFSTTYRPQILFSKESIWDRSNPWMGLRDQALGSWPAVRPDALFLAGLDWNVLDVEERQHPPVPIVNLIQHVRHAQPGDPRYQFLRHKAIRICVSEEVKTALAETHQVVGPLFVIPNGIDARLLPEPLDQSHKRYDVLVAAVKQPALGRQVAQRLTKWGRRVHLLTSQLLRSEFLHQVNRARATVFLPDPTEGFYLPALEGMALGTVVICPDCIGNRSFCLPGDTCFRPAYDKERIVEAAEKALRLSESERSHMLENGFAMAKKYDLIAERTAYLRILEDLHQLWQGGGRDDE